MADRRHLHPPQRTGWLRRPGDLLLFEPGHRGVRALGDSTRARYECGASGYGDRRSGLGSGCGPDRATEHDDCGSRRQYVRSLPLRHRHLGGSAGHLARRHRTGNRRHPRGHQCHLRGIRLSQTSRLGHQHLHRRLRHRCSTRRVGDGLAHRHLRLEVGLRPGRMHGLDLPGSRLAAGPRIAVLSLQSATGERAEEARRDCPQAGPHRSG